MSTLRSWVDVIAWPDMLMSHCLAARAARLLAEATFWTESLRPSRVAISLARSMSDPVGLPETFENAWGWFVRSEQTVSVPATTSWSAGSDATII